MILKASNKKSAEKFFQKIVKLGVDFKLQEKVNNKHLSLDQGKRLITKFPETGKSVEAVLEEFKKTILPYCTNFSSKNFMGFPDAGNSVAGISGALLYNFLQQNLINQSFCGPSATFVEIAVVQWLREVVGYTNLKVNDVWDVGGIITPGGTSSNSIGILLARENKFPDSMTTGISDPDKCWIVVPKGIGHYSVKSAQMWVGCGHRLIEAETIDYRYDLDDLRDKLEKNRGKIMCVIAYAGDSRTMTVENFNAVAKLVKSIDENIWLHADACHGFSLGFSKQLKSKISGIELFDSITTDPHKVMNTPYVISALLVKDPSKLKTITSKSDLIMQEQFAFGQITPFLGSRPWLSLKLWFVMKNFGKKGLDLLITNRHNLAIYLAEELIKDKTFVVLNNVDINAVAFMYVGSINKNDVERLNVVNKHIHDLIITEGVFHLHQFSVPDSGKLKKGEIVYPLRFMSGNPNTTHKDIDKMIAYVKKLGEECEKY